jgi:hypothetical protein
MAVGNLVVRVREPIGLPLPAPPEPRAFADAESAFRTGLAAGRDVGAERGRADARHLSATWLGQRLIDKDVMVYRAADRDHLGQSHKPWRVIPDLSAHRTSLDEPARLVTPESPGADAEIRQLSAAARRGRGDPAATHAQAYRLGVQVAYRGAWLGESARAVLRSALADTALVALGVRTSELRGTLAVCGEGRPVGGRPSEGRSTRGAGLGSVAALRASVGERAGALPVDAADTPNTEARHGHSPAHGRADGQGPKGTERGLGK